MVSIPDAAEMPDIRRNLTAAISRINADSRYSDTGKRNAIANAYLTARRQVDDLITKYETKVKTQRLDLERSLFGMRHTDDPAALISWRDAQDRADAIDSEQAAIRAFNRARNSGDTHLAKAVLQRAVHSGWHDIVQSADEVLPGSIEQLSELEQLPSDKSFALIRSTRYKLDMPTELNGASLNGIEQWADEHEPPSSAPGSAVALESIPADAPHGSVGEHRDPLRHAPGAFI
ncbi:hypothetical protein [Nocardia sp. CA-120079]|uniref:hypothetical protein n=1 Tax=Nocardia sp. CA-120079 TaxID=3239974 RepID=UPI003D994187